MLKCGEELNMTQSLSEAVSNYVCSATSDQSDTDTLQEILLKNNQALNLNGKKYKLWGKMQTTFPSSTAWALTVAGQRS